MVEHDGEVSPAEDALKSAPQNTSGGGGRRAGGEVGDSGEGEDCSESEGSGRERARE